MNSEDAGQSENSKIPDTVCRKIRTTLRAANDLDEGKEHKPTKNQQEYFRKYQGGQVYIFVAINQQFQIVSGVKTTQKLFPSQCMYSRVFPVWRNALILGMFCFPASPPEYHHRSFIIRPTDSNLCENAVKSSDWKQINCFKTDRCEITTSQQLAIISWALFQTSYPRILVSR